MIRSNLKVFHKYHSLLKAEGVDEASETFDYFIDLVKFLEKEQFSKTISEMNKWVLENFSR